MWITVDAHHYHKKTGFIELSPYGVSNENLYIPLFGLFTGEIFKFRDKKVLMYYPVVRVDGGMYQKVRDITGRKMFSYITAGRCDTFKVYDQRYITHKHCLYQVDNQLNVKFIFVLGIESEYLMQNIRSGISLNKSKMVMFVHKSIHAPEHLSVKKRFANYFQEYEEEIPIMYTNDVERWLFNNNLKKINLSTVNERLEFINKVTSNFN